MRQVRGDGSPGEQTLVAFDDDHGAGPERSGRDGDVAVFDLQESGHEVARHRIASRGAAVSVVAMCASRPSMLLTAAGARDDGAGAGGRGRLSLWRIVGTT